MRDLLSTTILGIIAVAVLVGAWSLRTEQQEFKPKEVTRVSVDLTGLTDRIIDSEVIGSGPDATVRFAYIGEPLPQKLDPEEVEWLRTENSWTINRTTQDVYDRGAYELETRIYQQKSFVRQGSEWRTVEYGETTKKEFEQAMGRPDYFAWLIPVAYADSARIYSAGGDGYSSGGGLGVSWAAVRSATDGASYSDSPFNTASVSSSVTSGKFGGAQIERVFLPFDTSTLSSAFVITSASLNIYAYTNTDSAGGSTVTVVQTSQATHTTLANADYDQVGTTQGTASPPSISTLSTSAYTTITLNATGLTWIKKSGQSSNCSATTGITCLGLRESHDINNTEPIADTGASVGIYTSEWHGTSNDPYLSVTYTAPQSVLSGGGIWMGGGGGKLNVVGGKVQIN